MDALATPERRALAADDRTLVHPFSRSAHPSPSRSLPANSQLTTEAALITANGDTSLALENVLSERNMLSSQNTQLWKLIEKQRAVHGNAIKELERVRADRDRALAKLDPERASRRTATHRSSTSSAASLNTSTRPTESPSPVPERQNGHRFPMIRHQSDDVSLSSPRPSTTSFPPLSSSRSHEPLRPPDLQPSSSTAPSPTEAAPQVPTPLPNGQATRPERSSTAPSASLSQPSSRTHSLPHLDPVPILSSSTHTQPLQVHKPQTAPLPQVTTTTMPLSVASAPTSASPSLEQSPPPLNSSLPANLSVSSMPNRALGRESRISLPDEARRYIASMQDSPIASPSSRQDIFSNGPVSDQIAEEPASLVPPDCEPKGLGIYDADHISTGPVRFRRESDDSSPMQTSQGPPNSDKSFAFLDLADDDDADGAGSASVEALADDPETTVASVSSVNPALEIRKTSDDQSQLPYTEMGATHEGFIYPDTMSPQRPQPTLNTHVHALASRDDTKAEANSPSSAATSHATPMTTHGSPVTMRIQNLNPVAQVQAQRMAYAQAHQQDFVNHTRETSNSPQSTLLASDNSNGRARLLEADLQHCKVAVVGSNIRANERGKEVLSFVVQISPSGAPDAADSWKVEKLYSDVLGLDARIRGKLSRSNLKKLGSLPDGKLFKDHAPAKVDQRKAILESYLQTVVRAPVKDTHDVCEFFSTDVLNEASAPVTQLGYKEGYLTKRGKNFGGWKTRYFVLQGPVLEYYESRGGAHLGSINITGAQIGRQQKAATQGSSDDENEYRHAFLIIEVKKGASVQHTRHVLCAESDHERDSWVEVLVRYVTGSYDDTGIPSVAPTTSQPRPSTSSMTSLDSTPTKRMMKADIAKGPAVPISQLTQDQMNAKLFQAAPFPESASTNSSPLERYPPSSGQDRNLQSITEVPLSSSLPTNLDTEGGGLLSQRAASELGHYPDIGRPAYLDTRGTSGQRIDRMHSRGSMLPSLSTVQSSPTFPTANGHVDRAPSPDPSSLMPPDASNKVKISGPINGTPIPAGYKFGAKDTPSDAGSSSDRDRKAKSRNFWGFGRDKPHASGGGINGAAPKAVFAVSISDSLSVAQIASLPAVVFRCIQYLEAKKADQEEGIYRLSGSSAVIKSLKDRFNAEGDVDLLASDEFWDPHAIAGLLKSFLRELPTSILTRDLHLRFLSVIDLADAKERVNELAHLISQLPVPNYSLLRALTAHLILIVQNASVNKMTMRNVGIVFSPTLGIPAGVFSLMLDEFNRVFNVDGDGDAGDGDGDGKASESSESEHTLVQNNRNSRSYADGAADQMLGLTGRSLKVAGEESDSADDITIPGSASGNETEDPDTTATLNKSSSDLAGDSPTNERREYTNSVSTTSKVVTPSRGSDNAANKAATRGLHISVERRRSGTSGLPHSPRPGLPLSPRPGSKSATPLA
ncbi:RhoGAP-domain-containing protein [Ramaria rubella]|nr:RhoGAP-domain-containing protein [Ramaria rubella]